MTLAPRLFHRLRVCALLLALFAAPGVLANKSPKDLRAIGVSLEQGGVPVRADNRLHGSLYVGDVYGMIDYPFDDVVAALASARNWCEIAPLHLNVKACTYEEDSQGARLTFYTGKKDFQTPERAQARAYRYRITTLSPDRFEAELIPEPARDASGARPLSILVLPQDAYRALVRVHYTHANNFLTRLAADGYFATIGNSKVGFTVEGKDRRGRPIYVNGIEGAIERNAARYFFALEAFLATRDLPESQRFEQRLTRWFDLTEQHRAQLHEIDRNVYLDHKRRERQEQARLQRAVDRQV